MCTEKVNLLKIGISATQNICWFMPLLARVQQDSKRRFPLQEEGEIYALVKKVKSALSTSVLHKKSLV